MSQIKVPELESSLVVHSSKNIAVKEGTFDEGLGWKKEDTWRFKMDAC